MKTDRQFQPELCVASPKMVRPQFENVLLDTSEDTPRLIATDGRMMAIFECEAGKGEAGPIPPAALKKARQTGSKYNPAEITLNSHCEFTDGSRMVRPTTGTEGAAKWREVVKPDAPVLYTLALDPTLLLTLAKALGSERSVRLEVVQFTDESRALRVNPKGKASGLMMLQK